MGEERKNKGSPAEIATGRWQKKDISSWLLCLAPLLPWLAWDGGSLYPYFEAKYAAWAGVACLLGVIWLIKGAGSTAVNNIDRVFFCWLGISGLSLILLPDVRIGLPDIAYRLAPALAYPLFRWWPAERRTLVERFSIAIAVAIEIQALSVTVQWLQARQAGLPLWDSVRLVGTIGYHNFAAAFIVAGLPIVAISLRSAGRLGKVALSLVMLHSTAVLIPLQSRAAFLALFCALGLYLLLSLGGSGTRGSFFSKKLLVCGAILLLVLVLASAALSRDRVGGLWQRTMEDLGSGHITGRRLIWMTAAEMLRTNHFMGNGLGCFYYGYIPAQGKVLEQFPPERFLPVMEMVIWAHDEFLQELVETGPVGLLLFGVLLFWPIYLALKKKSWGQESVFLGLALLSWTVVALFDFPLHRPSESILLFSLLGLIAGSEGSSRSWKLVPSRWLAISFLLLAILGTFLTIRHYASLAALNTALKAPAGTSREAAEGVFRKAISLSLRPGQAEAAYGAYLADKGRPSEGVHLMQKALATFRDAYLYENLGKADMTMGDLDRAAALYKEAMNSGNRNMTDASIQSKIDLRMGRRDEAVARLEGIRRVLPKNPDVNLVLAGIRFSEGRYEECIAILSPSEGKKRPEILNMKAAALIRLGRVEEAGHTLEDTVARWPDFAPAWANLGALRSAAGDSDGAGKAFQKALAIDPNNRTARAYLEKDATSNN